MMPRLDMDFARPAGRITLTAVVATLVGLGLALSVQADWYDAQEAVDRLEQRLARLPGGTRASAPTVLSDGQRSELARARQVIRQLTMPWEAILGALEGGLDDDVVLIAIDSDARRNTITLTAEARNPTAMLAYLDALADAPALANPVLVGHQEQEQIAERPIRFTIQVDWRVPKAAAPVAKEPGA